MKVKPSTISDQVIRDMIADIREYLCNGDEFRMNQEYHRMKHLFHSFAISIWEGANFGSNKYKKCNEVLIKECTKYYYTC